MKPYNCCWARFPGNTGTPKSPAAWGMQRLVSSWLWLLEQVLEQPQALVRSFSLLRASEQRELQAFLNGSSSPSGQQRLLHQLFEEQARRLPERIALISRQEALNYAEANRQANQLARWLRRQGVGPNVLVRKSDGAKDMSCYL